MYLKLFSLIPFCFALNIACTQFDVNEDESLTRIWIEESSGLDTIIMNIRKTEGELYLNRGFEIRNGYRLPKWGAGPYTYSVNSDSIELISLLSNCACGNAYYFKINPSMESFTIVNFYDEFGTGPQQLTFIKK